MRFVQQGLMTRIFAANQGEIAYLRFGLCAPCATIEFPGDWHEYRRAWIRVGLGVLRLAFSFPWRWGMPDQGQCSGPRFGFYFIDRAFVVLYGKATGRASRSKHIDLPWAWTHVRHDYLTDIGSLHHRAAPNEYSAPEDSKQKLQFIYVRRNGEAQHRTATVNGEEREWRWSWFKWLPFPRMIKRTINVEFDAEVGEGTGSWKGGTTGCSYDWWRDETQHQALLRMQAHRKFDR